MSPCLKAAEGCRTPQADAHSQRPRNSRSVLECASRLALWIELRAIFWNTLSPAYGDGCADALGTAEGETIVRAGDATLAAGPEGCADAEGETFAALADALAAGVVPGEPVAGAGAAVGIAINSRCKLVSLALRLA